MVGAGLAPCKIHSVALSTLFQVLPRALVSIVVQFQWQPALDDAIANLRCIFPPIPPLCTLALPAILAARRLSHSTGTKIPATNYKVFYRYFRAEYRYPHGTAVPVWTPTHDREKPMQNFSPAP